MIFFTCLKSTEGGLTYYIFRHICKVLFVMRKDKIERKRAIKLEQSVSSFFFFSKNALLCKLLWLGSVYFGNFTLLGFCKMVLSFLCIDAASKSIVNLLMFANTITTSNEVIYWKERHSLRQGLCDKKVYVRSVGREGLASCVRKVIITAIFRARLIRVPVDLTKMVIFTRNLTIMVLF